MTLTSTCDPDDDGFVVRFPQSENPDVMGIRAAGFIATNTNNGNTYNIGGGGNLIQDFDFGPDGIKFTTVGTTLYTGIRNPDEWTVPNGFPKSPIVYFNGRLEINFTSQTIEKANGGSTDVCAELA